MAHMIESPEKVCPMCGKPVAEQYRPFCSRRCADVDLNRWFSGIYAVPATEQEEDQSPPASDQAPQ